MIHIYTDGACSGNPGSGGWAALIVGCGETIKLHGGEVDTTNNRMEILAVLKGLEHIPMHSEVTVFSDSMYVINTMTKNWKRNKNTDLWERLDTVVQNRSVNWEWVKGHSGNPLNEEADRLAYGESKKLNGIQEKPLSHIDQSGKARMVDVGEKALTKRSAVASGSVRMLPETLELIKSHLMKKGDVLSTARIAGILGAKNTSQLIPLCHPLPIDSVEVEFEFSEDNSELVIFGSASTTAKTGVEMEALTAVSVAALTIYDMCKSVDKGISIDKIRLVEKTGGSSGDFIE